MKIKLSEEHCILKAMVEDFVLKEIEPQASEFDRKEEFNLVLFKKLAELGLLGLMVPLEYEGGGADPLASVIVHEELSFSDPGFCLAYLAHSVLCVNNICQNASEDQKQKYLPQLCSGEFIGAMAMSEPHVGTDVLNMKTTASLQRDHYLINGEKMWITNGQLNERGTLCDVVWLYVKTGESISSFIIEKGFEGLHLGQKIRDKLGMRASNTSELVFKNCKAPLSSLVGEEGSSLDHMMRNLEIERLTLASMSLGIAKRCIKEMVKYSNQREAFGKNLSHFGQIQKHIADSYASYQAAKSYIYNLASQMRYSSVNTRVDSDAVKLFASTMGKKVADSAIQVLGGYGYVGEYTVSRLWRDSKLLEIGGGTLEAHQKNITKDLSKNYQQLDLFL